MAQDTMHNLEHSPKQPIILCDVGGTLLDENSRPYLPLGQKLMELKDNGVDIYMATDGSARYANQAKSILKYLDPDVEITFTDLISKDTFNCEKNTTHYWENIRHKFQDTAIILVDDNLPIINIAKNHGIETVLARGAQQEIIANLNAAYKKTYDQLNH
jgi:FMN phosphatase YigB (HAD superfamily)